MSDLSTYQSKMPGVYIEEISAGSNPIVGVGTSTAAFIGKAATDGDDTPKPITSWNQFVDAYTDINGNTFIKDDGTNINLPYAVYCFFNEGGTRCYVVNESSPYDGVTAPWVEELQKIDDINIIAFPDMVSSDADAKNYIKLGYEYCYEREYCFFIIDSLQEDKTLTDIKTAVSQIGDISLEGGRTVKDTGLNKYSAVYFPWLEITNPGYNPYGSDDLSKKKTITVPPSGAIAGIYARTDANRGVWKAPAGLSDGRIYSAKDVNLKFSEGDYGDMNCHNINAIRNIKDTGVSVWGARTVALFENASDACDVIPQTEWKYINIRRLFNYIEESLYEGNQWVVFEPNGPELWSIVNRNITAFLTDEWKDGAFYGTTAEEAFFVKVDKDNNPPDLREQGLLIIDVGIAPIYPAEFVIIRITQKMQTE